jgi:hypothetical protein
MKSPEVTAGTKPDQEGEVTFGVATRFGSRPSPGSTASTDVLISAPPVSSSSMTIEVLGGM